jgi:hypothetical protein
MSYVKQYGLPKILNPSLQRWRCPEGPVVQHCYPEGCRIPSYTSSLIKSNLGWPTLLEKL